MMKVEAKNGKERRLVLKRAHAEASFPAPAKAGVVVLTVLEC